jgi:hypothetical protein
MDSSLATCGTVLSLQSAALEGRMTVNLDTMIERADFEMDDVSGVEIRKPGNELYLASLTKDGRLASFRKPEFQRETSAWTPEIVSDFIKSVVEANVVPAIIMWHSPSEKFFIIDGAHRLSALIAWIEDDYGDREISNKFFGHLTDEARVSAAQKTRELVELKVGKYETLRGLARNPSAAPDDAASRRASTINNFPLYLQWVSGDAKAAEQSYVRINSTAVAIDKTEKDLIETRHKANGLAARAVLHSGAGYEYWREFQKDVKTTIKALAQEISNQLIKPIAEFPQISLNLPVQEKGHSAASVKNIHDLVEFINPPRTSKGKSIEPDDTDGSATVACMQKIKALTARAFTKDNPGSLALHPGIYCFGATGKFIPKAFFGAIGFVNELEKHNRFYRFTKHRNRFEEFLIRHRYFVNQISAGQGSGGRRGVAAVTRLLDYVFESIAEGLDDKTIIRGFKKDTSLAMLYVPPAERPEKGRKFTKDAEAAAFLAKTMEHEFRCDICGARLYRKAMSKDHKQRHEDGGDSRASNLEFTHPYCNTGFKEKQASLKRKKA